MSHSEIRLGRSGRPTAAIKRPFIEFCSPLLTVWCRYRPPDVLLGSTNYTTSLDMWGAGCIFVEMLLGYPAFPGVRDTWDQLDKIFRVVGTPTEDCWPGVSRLPNYRPHKLVCYPAPPRGQVSSQPWTRRKDINILTFCFCSWRTFGRGCTTSPSPSTWRARCCSRARRGACPRRLRCGTATSATCRPACTASTPGPACTACRASPSTTTTIGKQQSCRWRFYDFMLNLSCDNIDMSFWFAHKMGLVASLGGFGR